MGAHGSRTLMLAELRRLLDLVPAAAPNEAYRSSVLDENTLQKDTVGTRGETLRRLRELYGLDPTIPLYRAMRGLWDVEPGTQPVLALLCALARDPTLLVTADAVLTALPGEPVSGERLGELVRVAWPGRFSARTLINIGRNTASTWTQSGHLRGRLNKVRALVAPTPISATFALLLGHLCGHRGEALLMTFWTRTLDASPSKLRALAFEASRQGWLEYRTAAGVTEMGFQHLLGEDGQP